MVVHKKHSKFELNLSQILSDLENRHLHLLLPRSYQDRTNHAHLAHIRGRLVCGFLWV